MKLKKAQAEETQLKTNMNNSSKVRPDDLYEFNALTKSQQEAFGAWDDGDHLVLAGSAGTGKTFIAMYLALEALLNKQNRFDKVIILRSIVPVREIGYLPGTLAEKQEVYETPYKGICEELFHDNAAYNKLKNNHQLFFESTSFIRGQSFRNAVVIVDEMQNLNFHELDSVMTRLGDNCRIIFCGDYYQSDFTYENEKDGVNKFLRIVDRLRAFSVINFKWHDIVRSGLVRDYIMTKEELGIK